MVYVIGLQSKYWQLSFNITVLSYTEEITSIIHFTGEDNEDLSIHNILSFSMNNTSLIISFQHNGSIIHHDINVQTNVNYNIKFRQQWSMSNAVNVKIFVDDVEIFSKRNTNPKQYKNLRCYIGNLWNEPANDNIKNLT